METVTFDTHQAVKAITRSGLNDTQAEAIVPTITTAMNQSLATKSDFLALRVDTETLKANTETLRVDTEALKVDTGTLKVDMKALRADTEILKVDMKALTVDMEALRGEFLVLKWMVGVVIVVEVLPHLKFLLA